LQCSTNCGAGQRVGQLSCEQISISRGERPTVVPVDETGCLYRLGSNISLQIDSRGEDPTVYIVERGSSEEREAFQRAPYLRPLPFTPGKPLFLACSNPPCHSRSLEWVASEWSKCSATCGVGYQRRSVRCLLVERHAGPPSKSEVVGVEKPESECTARGLARPTDMQPCEASPCVKWSPGDWSEVRFPPSYFQIPLPMLRALASNAPNFLG
uniref:ADAM_spacer1 domain-containing protein n=1 Tax=Taenia asiatica TaxID=60517 RepID=A0A0R3VZX6_TAEAS